jgi:phytoene/squalene synthetase
MSDGTAVLARSTTWAGSKQTYFTAKLLVDRDLVDDFYRAYAYFRWADDVIDESAGSDQDRNTFIRRQRDLIDQFYEGDQPGDLSPEEQILADLISGDRAENSGLQSFIRNMFAIIEFDAYRVGWEIDREELSWYIHTLSISVTEGIHYFIGNGIPQPESEYRFAAAEGAHIAHLLRDAVQDTADGYINIPAEYLEEHDVSPDSFDSDLYRTWVQERVELARKRFKEGKLYLNDLQILRTKIAGYWYSARFEGVLDTIESDDFVLREKYSERSRIRTWLNIGWIGIGIIVKHLFQRVRGISPLEDKSESPVMDPNIQEE